MAHGEVLKDWQDRRMEQQKEAEEGLWRDRETRGFDCKLPAAASPTPKSGPSSMGSKLQDLKETASEEGEGR